MIGIQLTPDYAPDIRPQRDEAGRILSGLVLGDILPQNQALILLLHPGELKESPALGCGISDMLLDDQPLLWRTRIREGLELDGQVVRQVTLTTTGIHIDAHY